MVTELMVVKVGGHEVDDAAWLASLAKAVVPAGPLVVVHGGGKEVSAVQERLGLVPAWRDGLRVTDADALAVVSMVLSGLVNKRLVSALIGAGVRAAGVSGEDDGVLSATAVAGGALGRTGEVAMVRPELLLLLLEAGIAPVVSPLSRGPDGGALNVNADDAAVAIAAALGARRLLFVSNVPGVRFGPDISAELRAGAVEAAIESGAVTGGMAPKLRAAARAATAGVAEVRIGGIDLLSGGAGTRVSVAGSRTAGERAA